MKSTRTIVIAVALGIGLILATSAGATSWHLENFGVPYIPYTMTMLVSLNLLIIVALGLITTVQGNGWSVRSREKNSRNKFDLNTNHEQPAVQSCVARMGRMIDATVGAVSRQCDSRGENAEFKAGVTPVARQEKPAQPKLRQADVDACWIRKRRESHS